MSRRSKILLIGTTSDVMNNRFTGQSIMFDGVVSAVEACGNDVKVLDISSRKGNTSINRILDYSYILIRLLFLLCTYRVSLVYLVTSQSRRGFYRDYLIILFSRLFRIKVVTHQYGANYKQMLNSMSKLELNLLTKTLDYVSKIIVEGEYMKSQFSFYVDYADKVVVIPNGLPTEGKQIGRPKTYDRKTPFTLFYLSNLIYSKGYFDVLKAVNSLVNEHKMNVNCIFAGQFINSADDVYSGISNKVDFDNYILQHGLSDYVKYFPGLYGDEKAQYFYTSHVFILPTYYINEGQPVSILGAMAYGCVPVVTKYRHIPMMVNEKNGCFVEPSSPESICKAIISLIDNTDTYSQKSKQAIEEYRTKYTFERFSDNVLGVINKAINK